MIEEYGLDAANMTVLPEPDSLPDVTGYFDPGTFNAPAVEHELPVTVFEPVADTDHIEPWIPVTETDPSSDVIDQPENESYPAVNIPYSEAAEWDEAAIGTEETVDDIKPARLSPVSVCPFCRHENSPHAVRCDGCLAVLTLSDLEMLLSNRECRSDLIEKVTEKMEAERVVRQLHEDELVTLGIGHLNLKNLDVGFSVLRDASQANPNNVILGSQVNALAIRLEEIKNQPETNGAALLAKAILVVDDSMTVRKLISGKLEKNGHKVVCAEDGADAIAVLENFVPDLVLLDIDMPKMDGYQVCKLIRSKSATKDVPVIMISGKDGFFDKVRGKMAGSTDHISKPFGPETLMKALENYLSDVVPQQ
jgi:Response regulators consisting of a CheY-like receiver domain and a winged-helix DNA-binding domain